MAAYFHTWPAYVEIVRYTFGLDDVSYIIHAVKS